MAFDIIVFSQEELLSAVNNGITSICVCDNSFILPLTEGVTYTAIGDARAVIYTDKSGADNLNITFNGFTPVFVPLSVAVTSRGASYGTSASSYSASYFLGSYSTSYAYGYEYGSFNSSYRTSFGSGVSSFLTSFRTENAGGGKCILVNGYGINLI